MRLIAATAVSLLAFIAPALAETSVGVTAAVNQDAKGTVGSNVKTISLGDSVVYNQRIETGGSGLVQVLLADGTTFMVGPNSDLVIDSFVYDPNAGTAQVTASFTKGVLRFIGGQTSKTENGVVINTPVGTMGIRGAMVDVVLNPPAGTPPHVDMLFGNEVTLENGQQLLGRLYAAGYSLALGTDGAFDVLRTPPGWGSQIQAALAGKLGTNGGAIKGPSDGDVKNSDAANNNSGNGVDKNTGNDGLTKEERDALIYAAAHYDELRRFILNNQNPYGLVGGVLSSDDYPNDALALQNAFDIYGEGGPNPVFAKFGFDSDNNPVAVAATLGLFGDTCTALDGCLNYEGGVDSGSLQFIPQEGAAPPAIPVDGYLLNHDAADVASVVPGTDLGEGGDDLPEMLTHLNCLNCKDFIRWGFWGFSANDLQVGAIDGNLNFDSTWVNGDLATADELLTMPTSGDSATAHYHGDAIGTVNNGGDVYTATGDFKMVWNFGSRQGWVGIDDFDKGHLNDGAGTDLDGSVISFEDQTGFGGFIHGHHSNGIVQGAFVNDGSDIAAGVIGNFGFNKGPNYTASGVFMGDQATPGPTQ